MDSKREKRKEDWKLRQLVEADNLTLRKDIQRILNIPEQERCPVDAEAIRLNAALTAELYASTTKLHQRQLTQKIRSQEIHDPPAVLSSSIDQLAHMILEAQKVGGVIIHTGAGLSTSAGIPDFRGPQGVWTLQAKGQAVAMSQRYEEVGPTRAHMVIGEMVKRKLVRHVVTQNVDGLHIRSEVPDGHLSELHGCVYREFCSKCHLAYARAFDVTQPQGSSFRRHLTGRVCENRISRKMKNKDRDKNKEKEKDKEKDEDNDKDKEKEKDKGRDKAKDEVNVEDEQEDEDKDREKNENEGEDKKGVCGGALVDSIVHFGEKLNVEELERARGEAKAAHLALGLGSTWKVPPANQLLRMSQKLAIVNLQWTTKDRCADLKIHASLDTVMCQLAERLGIQVAEYEWRRDTLLKGLAGPPSSLMRKDEMKMEAGGSSSGAKKRKGKGSQPSFPKAKLKVASVE